jgi:hypothetical protein
MGDEKLFSDEEPSAATLRERVAKRRHSVSESAEQLSERIQRTIDWREQLGRHPYASLGVAATVGVVAARLLTRRRSPAERVAEALADAITETARPIQRAVRRATHPGLATTKDLMKAAFASAASELAIGFMRGSTKKRRRHFVGVSHVDE